MEEKLVDRLVRTAEALRKETMSVERLESLWAETRAAFDSAMRRMPRGVNYREELARRREQLRKWKLSVPRTLFPFELRDLVGMPFIYGMIVPMVFFHACLELYHRVCFRLFGIPLVRPSEYFINDRQLLPYLNWFEKFNCVYCSYYANLVRYAAEIGGRTERYWCPIKYSRRITGQHSQYPLFVEYLDAEGYRTKGNRLRDFSDLVEGTRKDGETVDR